MKKTTSLKKNLNIQFSYYKAYVGTAENLSMTINDINICSFGPRCIRIIESIFDHNFINGETIILTAKTFKVDKACLYINDTFVTDFDYTRLWLINEAFAPITSYSIHINHDQLSWTYSWSLDWHVQNLSNRVEDIDNIKPENLDATINQLKAKYKPLVTKNCIYAFEIIEYRTDEFNRIYKNESVGYEPENFDENIRAKIFH